MDPLRTIEGWICIQRFRRLPQGLKLWLAVAKLAVNSVKQVRSGALERDLVEIISSIASTN
jgi:hypothetical protein